MIVIRRFIVSHDLMLVFQGLIVKKGDWGLGAFLREDVRTEDYLGGA